jgi:hypothetical protein
MNKYILILTISAFFTSCSTATKESTTDEVHFHDSHDHNHGDHGDPRTKELMAIHDSIMPAMETIMELKQKIALEIIRTDSLLASKPNPELKSRKTAAVKLQKELEIADEEMMHWMHQYDADTLDKMDDNGATAYIATQKSKIASVKELMAKSIREAKLFIEKSN